MNGEKKNGSAGVIILAIVMVALLAVAGVTFFIILNKESNRNSGNEGTAEASNAAPGALSGRSVLSDETEEKLRTLREVIDEAYLFGTEDVDFDTAVIRAYMDALGDPYSVYYTPEEYDDMMESSRGTFFGIGVSIQQDVNDMSVTVIQVFRGSPAEEAGVKPGDVIYAVDGVPVGDDDINVTVTKVRGPENSKVKITFYRPSLDKNIDLEITRREVQVDSAVGEMLDDHIGLISLTSFDEITYGQFAKAFNELADNGMQGIVFDLRNNGGGLLSSVVDIVDALAPEGIITYTLDKNGHRDEYKSDAADALTIPAVILTNGNTASASEIFTAALHDYGKATVVGTTTFGKGIVQMIYPLNDGSGLKLTVSRYYTPNGVCIHGEGIDPDVEVEEDPETEEDEQLLEAIRILKEKMK